MFNAKKNGTTPSGEGFSINSLGAGSEFTGNITATQDIRIDGVLKGNLKCKERVIIGLHGKVTGEMHCESAIIEGEFQGDMVVSNTLEVLSKATITGNVSAGILVVEKGAVFHVQCTMALPDGIQIKPPVTDQKPKPQPANTLEKEK